MNAFKHGICSQLHTVRLEQAARARRPLLLAHMRDLVDTYRDVSLSRTQRANLIQQAGITVLTSWYGLCLAIQEEQSRQRLERNGGFPEQSRSQPPA